jgi:hypothetical protein
MRRGGAGRASVRSSSFSSWLEGLVVGAEVLGRVVWRVGKVPLDGAGERREALVGDADQLRVAVGGVQDVSRPQADGWGLRLADIEHLATGGGMAERLLDRGANIVYVGARDDPGPGAEGDPGAACSDAPEDELLAALRVVLAVDEAESQYGRAGGEVALLDVELLVLVDVEAAPGTCWPRYG